MSPSSPVSAVRSSWPRASSPTRHTLSRSGSSSMMRMCGMRRLLGKGGGKRKGEAESGAAPGRVVHPDSLIVRFDECLCDHEPEPGAGVVTSAGKQFENLVTALRADARTLVRHRDLDEMFLCQCGTHRNRLRFRTMAYGVFEQIGEHPTDKKEVGGDWWQVIIDISAYVVDKS